MRGQFFLISWRLGLRTKKTCTYNNENLQASRRLEGRMVAVLGRVVDKWKSKFKLKHRDEAFGKPLIDTPTRMVKRKRAPRSNEWKHASLQSLCFLRTYLEHYQVECFNSCKISERCGVPRRSEKLKSAIMLPYFLPLPSLSRRPRVAEALAEAQASCVVGLFPPSTFLLLLSYVRP